MSPLLPSPGADTLATPFFLISEQVLIQNLGRIREIKEMSGAKIVLALKCFSTWGVFPVMAPYLDGTTSSGPYEVRLGHENFGGETHAYSVGFSRDDIAQVNRYADKIIFNSLSQYDLLRKSVSPRLSVGIRFNPGIGHSRNQLADPARPGSRLGVRLSQLQDRTLEGVEGAMFHVNCENDDFDSYDAILRTISHDFGTILENMSWVSLGGGVSFTAEHYPYRRFAQRVRDFSRLHGVTVYLEPGEAVVTKTTNLVVSVLDIVDGDTPIAIVDSATEAHRLDTLIFGEPPLLWEATPGGLYRYVIGSCSCLAGDVFCEAAFEQPLAIGDRLHILDSGGYTMVKLNWFNGLRMPNIYLERCDGTIETLNEFTYDDYAAALSRPKVDTASSRSDRP